MTRVPRPAMSVTEAALRRQFCGRWAIGYDELHQVWSAERREGAALRFLAAHQAWELAAKIEAAEATP